MCGVRQLNSFFLNTGSNKLSMYSYLNPSINVIQLSLFFTLGQTRRLLCVQWSAASVINFLKTRLVFNCFILQISVNTKPFYNATHMGLLLG